MVARRRGFDDDEALTLGRAVAGLNAYTKSVALGILASTSEAVREQRAALRQEELSTSTFSAARCR